MCLVVLGAGARVGVGVVACDGLVVGVGVGVGAGACDGIGVWVCIRVECDFILIKYNFLVVA